jgi:hypothetical protein
LRGDFFSLLFTSWDDIPKERSFSSQAKNSQHFTPTQEKVSRKDLYDTMRET